MDTTAAKLKVLIIDDSSTIRLIVKGAFEKEGFNVSFASEGNEGVHLAFIDTPDIIILDIMMEGLQGFEVCKMLRSNTNLRHTAIIIISGKSYKSDIDRALKLGADSYVVKPFTPKEICEIAIEQMNKRRNQI
jgi:DNA-binding response OmpR family regulator